MAAVALVASVYSPTASSQGPGPESAVHVSALACKRMSGNVTMSFGRVGAGSGGAVVRCPIHLDRWIHNIFSSSDITIVATGGHSCDSGGSGSQAWRQQYIDCTLNQGAWLYGYSYGAHHVGAGSTPSSRGLVGLQDVTTACYARPNSTMRCPLIRREESGSATSVRVSFNRTVNVGYANCRLYSPANMGGPERSVAADLLPTQHSMSLSLPLINDTLLVECILSGNISIATVTQNES